MEFNVLDICVTKCCQTHTSWPLYLEFSIHDWKKNNCCSFYKLMQIFSITSSYVVSNKEFYYFSEMLSY